MGTKVAWTTFGTNITKFNIYRSDTYFDSTNKPAVLSEVLGDIREYVDVTAVRNKVYYYAVETVSEAGESLSKAIALSYMPYTGPGPQTLQAGDYVDGYFGEVTSLGGAVDLYQKLGSLGTITNNTMWVYHKFVIDGEIYFVPNCGLSTNVHWQSIYNAGLLFNKPGTNIADINSSIRNATGFVETEQYKEISLGGHIFKVSSPWMPQLRYTNVAAFQADLPNSIFQRTVGRLFAPINANSVKAWAKQRVNGLVAANWLSNGGYRAVHTTQQGGETDTVFSVSDANERDMVNTAESSTSNAYKVFYPILKLVI